MTSKNSFFKLLKEDLRQRLWSIILAMVVILLPITIAVLLLISNAPKAGTAEWLQNNLESCFKYQNFWYYLVVIFGSFICAGCSFGYLFSKKKVDFFHGLPVSRTEQFAVRYLSGVLVYLVPNLCMLLLNSLLIAVSGNFSGELAKTMFAGLVWHFFGFLILYNAFCICLLLVGNFFVWCVVIGWMFAYVPAAVLVFGGMQDNFYRTYMNSGNGFFEMMQPLRFLSPFYYYCIWMADDLGRMNRVSDGAFLFQSLIYIVVLAAISYVLYRLRPSEGAGKAIVFKWAKSFIRISSELLIGIDVAFFFYLMVGNKRVDGGWIIFGGILGVVLCHMFIESILHYDVRKCFADKLSMAVVAVVAIVFTLGMRYDVTGYDTYLPKQKKIISVEIETKDITMETMVSKEYSNSITLTDIALVYPFLEECRNRNMADRLEWGYGGYYDSLKSSYGTGEDLPGQWIRFGMKLKSGRTVYRSYYIPEGLFATHYGILFNSAEYKAEYLKGLKALTPEQLNMVFFQTEEYETKYVEAFTDTDKKALIASLIAGYERMDWQTRYNSAPKFLVTLYVNFSEEERNYIRNKMFVIPVYDCYTETIAIAKRRGFAGVGERDWSKVESMMLTLYDADGIEIPTTEVSYADTAGIEFSAAELAGDLPQYAYTVEGMIWVAPKYWEQLYKLCVWEGLVPYSLSMGTNTKEDYSYPGRVTMKVYTDDYGNYTTVNYWLKKGADLSFLNN